MSIDSVKILDGKKFLWDGLTYNNERDAKEAMSTYEQSGFEVRMVEKENKYLVYTRRVVTNVVVEGQPPL
jgi:hypothetical protein